MPDEACFRDATHKACEYVRSYGKGAGVLAIGVSTIICDGWDLYRFRTSVIKVLIRN